MKTLTFIIIGFAFILIAGVFWITHSTHKPEQNNTQTTTPKKISPANLKTISAKTKKTLSSLANSGADKASLSELNQLIKELNNYSTEKK